MGKLMKRKRVFGLWLALSMLTMTACGSIGDVAPSTIQDSQSDVQAYESEAQETQPVIQEDESEKAEPEIPDESDVDEESETQDGNLNTQEDEPEIQEDVLETEEPQEETKNDNLPIYGNYYYDVVNVVLYLDAYNELPPNYITKSEAQALGWEGGSVEKYKEGAAIGGDYFGNREGLLPAADGRKYTECDIYTHGYSSRGSRRLVFSNDGLYFYTSDHYESFSEVTVTEDYEVIW